MDLNTAIKAHVEWLILLVDKLEGRAEPELDVHAIRNEGHCKIGIWLNHIRDQVGHLPEFQQTWEMHVLFHEKAADIVARLHLTDPHDAVQELERLSGEASDEFILCLADLIHSIRHADKVSEPSDEPNGLALGALLQAG